MKSSSNYAQQIQAILANFDNLPDSAFVDLKVISAHRNRSIASTWRDIKANRLPKPHHIGRSARINIGEYRKSLVKGGM